MKGTGIDDTPGLAMNLSDGYVEIYTIISDFYIFLKFSIN